MKDGNTDGAGKPSSTAEARLVVEMRGIVKRFPGVLANDHVDFDGRRRSRS
jgi:ABC-type sugar transport system ATPase subunit